MSANTIRNKSLRVILSDNTSGSVEILNQLVDWLKTNSEASITEFIEAVRESFPAFYSIINFINDLETKVIFGNVSLQKFIENYNNSLDERKKQLQVNAARTLSPYKNIITISNSSTLQECFVHLYSSSPALKIFVSEGRPINEGQILAKNLLAFGINVELITEAMIGTVITRVQAAVIGADTILKNGDAINKVGSRMLAVLCKHHNLPFFVVADRTKFASENNFQQLRKDPKEIWDTITSITINNFYFERLEAKLITKIISD